MAHHDEHRVDLATLRSLAVEASADPRSVARVLRGERVRGMAEHRIREVLARRGIQPRSDHGGRAA